MMGVFSAFSLPIQGLKVGIHEYQYTLNASFFKLFEDSLIGESELIVSVVLDKRYDMMILDFGMEGWIQSDCDRCSASINLPISSEQTLFVKYSEGKEEEDEVIFIHREAPELNLAKYLYEFVVLSLPISSTYDCEKEDPRPCNMEVLTLLNSSNEDKDDSSGTSVWDVLKGLK
jgi:uncharacterized metal-binding protein YceD (DUF177 family)